MKRGCFGSVSGPSTVGSIRNLIRQSVFMRFQEPVCRNNSHEWFFLSIQCFKLCLTHQSIGKFHKEIITCKSASSVIFLPTSHEAVKNTFFLLSLFLSLIILSCPASHFALGSEKLYDLQFQNCLMDVSAFEWPT